MDLAARLSEFRSQEQKINWEGTFQQYYDLVKANPDVAQLSHARIFNMIMSAGVSEGRDGMNRFHFFDDELFGMERPLQQIVDYFNSAAQRLEVRTRILLLMGPVGGGKSTIVTLLKRGMEQFTRSDAGALYSIK